MRTDELWGGILEAISIEPALHIVSMIVNVNAGARIYRHELRLEGVREFRFFHSSEEPWNYADLTEIHLDRGTADRVWTIDIVLWSEEAGLVARCDSVILDGVEV